MVTVAMINRQISMFFRILLFFEETLWLVAFSDTPFVLFSLVLSLLLNKMDFIQLH